MFVKICGITSPEMAEFAALEGADYIGLVFEPSSKRFVTPEEAAKISKAAKASGAKVVGVFVSQSKEEIERIIKEASLDLIQLHGAKAKESAENLTIPRIFLAPYGEAVNERDFLLYDNVEGGLGKPILWEEVKSPMPFFLAGGLSPDNVKEAIEKTSPMGVDVSTGVEDENGQKSKELIRRFIQRSKYA